MAKTLAAVDCRPEQALAAAIFKQALLDARGGPRRASAQAWLRHPDALFRFWAGVLGVSVGIMRAQVQRALEQRRGDAGGGHAKNSIRMGGAERRSEAEIIR
jgi:hypothetical protein